MANEWMQLIPGLIQSQPGSPQSVEQQLRMQDMQLKLQQNQQAIQGQNALKQILGNRQNYDNAGNLNPGVLPQIGGLDPEKMLELQKNMASLMALRVKQSEGLLRGYQQSNEAIVTDMTIPGYKIYQDTLEKTHSPEQAIKAAQDFYDQTWPQLAANLPPERRAQIERMGVRFVPDTALASMNGTEAGRAFLKSQTEGYHLTTETGPGGTEREVFVGPGKPALDVAGNRVTPTGQPPANRDMKPEYVGDIDRGDGKPETNVPLLFNPALGFVDARTRQPVPPDQLRNPRRMGAGSQASPEGIDATAQLIANYQQPPLSSYAMKSGNGPEIMRRVQEINPNYSASKYQAAARTRTAFDIGRQGDQVRSLNVAIQHLGVFDDLGKALQNRDTLAINRVLNYVQSEMGHPEVKNFDTAKQIIGDEVIKSVIGSGAALSDREGLQRQFNSASSPAQLQQVAGTIKRLMAGQLSGLRRQFTASGLPADEFNDKLDPDTVKALEGSEEGRSGAASSSGNRVMLGNDAAENQRRMASAPPGTTFQFPDGSTLTKPKAPQ